MSSRRVLTSALSTATKPTRALTRPCRQLHTQRYPIPARRALPTLLTPPPRRFDSSHQAPIKSYTYEQVTSLSSTPTPSHTLIDTREPSELASTGKIPGAINIPVSSSPDAYFLSREDFEDRFGIAKPDLETELVMYCKAGVRSRAAVRLAEEAGYKRVGSYDGSWLEWSGKGGEVEKA